MIHAACQRSSLRVRRWNNNHRIHCWNAVANHFFNNGSFAQDDSTSAPTPGKRHNAKRCRSVSTLATSPLVPTSIRPSSVSSSVYIINDRQPLLMKHPIMKRGMSTWLPEAFQGFSIWGGSSILLNTFHMDGVIPYWACFSLINIFLRILLFPVVIHGARMAIRFGKVTPELQFLYTMYQNDRKKLKEANASPEEFKQLRRVVYESFRGIFALNKVSTLAIFHSPLIQIPCFYYMSIDLRKIINGRDPQLAQDLTESRFFWVEDLTDPDPYFVLPILAGFAMYANVETAVGRRSLTGEAASKADMNVFMKDLFQSFAIFIPCFASHSPAGMQIYLCTGFVFTIFQHLILRNKDFRSFAGLDDTPGQAKYAMKLIELKELEKKAQEIRGDGELLGTGVLARGWELSFPGTYRKSTIQVDEKARQSTVPTNTVDTSFIQISMDIQNTIEGLSPMTDFSGVSTTQFIPGISASPKEMAERQKEAEYFKQQQEQQQLASSSSEETEASDELIEKAKRGEKPIQTKFISRKPNNKNAPTKLSLKRWQKGKAKTKRAASKKSKPRNR